MSARIFWVFLVFWLLIGTPLGAATHLIITNDSYGKLTLDNGEQLWAKVSAYVNTLRKQGETVYWLDGGNHSGPEPEAVLFKGERHMGLLMSLGIDGYMPGRYDFAWRRSFVEAQPRPWLLSNVYEGGNVWKKDKNFSQLDWPKLRVYGIVQPDLPLHVKEGYVSGLRFLSETEALKTLLIQNPPKSQQRVVVLAQIPYDRCVTLLQQFPQLHTVVSLLSSADDRGFKDASMQDGQQVIGSRRYGRELLDLTLPDNSALPVTVRRVLLSQIKESDPVVSQLSESIMADYNYQSTPNLGELMAEEASDFSQFALKAMASFSQIPLAVLPQKVVRETPKAGPVTLADLRRALPFEDRVMAARYTGRVLKQIMAQAAQASDGPHKLLYVGYREGYVEGIPIFDDDEYWVVTTGYLFDGGGGYNGFKQYTSHYLVEDTMEHLMRQFIGQKRQQTASEFYERIRKPYHMRGEGELKARFQSRTIASGTFSGVSELSGHQGSGGSVQFSFKPQFYVGQVALRNAFFFDFSQWGGQVLANDLRFDLDVEPIRRDAQHTLPFGGLSIQSAIMDPEGDSNDILKRLTLGFSSQFLDAGVAVHWGVGFSHRQGSSVPNVVDVGPHLQWEQQAGELHWQGSVFQALSGTEEQEIKLVFNYGLALGGIPADLEYQVFRIANRYQAQAGLSQRVGLWINLPIHWGEY